MKDLNPQKTGLVLGVFLLVVHVIWSIMVMIGLAQWWLDFVLGLHFLNNPLTVGTFDIVRAVLLWVVTFVVGFIYGYLFAFIWNKVLREVK